MRQASWLFEPVFERLKYSYSVKFACRRAVLARPPRPPAFRHAVPRNMSIPEPYRKQNIGGTGWL